MKKSGQKSSMFTLIELLVVIAIIAILSRSKNFFFLLFSAIQTFAHFCSKYITIKNEMLH